MLSRCQISAEKLPTDCSFLGPGRWLFSSIYLAQRIHLISHHWLRIKLVKKNKQNKKPTRPLGSAWWLAPIIGANWSRLIKSQIHQPGQKSSPRASSGIEFCDLVQLSVLWSFPKPQQSAHWQGGALDPGVTVRWKLHLLAYCWQLFTNALLLPLEIRKQTMPLLFHQQ